MSGYVYCACGGCFDVTVGDPGALCDLCEEAGCEAGGECCQEDEPMDEPTRDELKRLTDIHIQRYEGRLVAAQHDTPFGRTVNVAECRRYLAIWRTIERAGYDWSKLTIDAKREVEDAVAGGE